MKEVDFKPLRVIRGGSWYGDAGGCRAGDRDDCAPDFRYGNLGLRLSMRFVRGKKR